MKAMSACRFQADSVIFLHDEQPHVEYLPTKVLTLPLDPLPPLLRNLSPLQILHPITSVHNSTLGKCSRSGVQQIQLTASPIAVQ